MAEGESSYLLFNSDKTIVELFLPTNNEGIILQKSNEGNWVNKNYKLISWKSYVLQKDGKAIFGGE